MVGRFKAPIRDAGTRCAGAPCTFVMPLLCALKVRGYRSKGRSVASPYDPRMSPGPTPRVRTRLARAAILAALIAIAAVAAGCGAPPFDASAPCTADSRLAGAYPALEALVPREFRDRGPDLLDSGRTCTDVALGTLKAHDVRELRFAGATWVLGASSGVSIAILEADELQADWVADFYEAGARAARNSLSVETSATEVDGRPASRIDTLNGESYQTVIVSPDGQRVRVVIVASFVREIQTKEAHEAVVTEAIAAAFPG
jgi:hypothetical protein